MLLDDTYLYIIIVLGLLSFFSNIWIKRSLEKNFDTLSGIYSVMVMDCEIFALTSVVTIFWSVAFLVNYAPTWLCVVFHFCHYPPYLSSLACGLFISIVRNRIIRASFKNEVSITEDRIRILSRLIPVASLTYSTILYHVNHYLKIPLSSLLSLCLNPNKPTQQYQLNSITFGGPVVIVCTLACLADLNSFLIIRQHVSNITLGLEVRNNADSMCSVPFATTLTSAGWLFPHILMVFLFGLIEIDEKWRMTFLVFYHRFTHLIRCPIMYRLTLSHKSQLEAS